MVFSNSSFKMSILLSVFEGQINICCKNRGNSAPRQRAGVEEGFKGPSTNTVRTPIAKAIWGTLKS